MQIDDKRFRYARRNRLQDESKLGSPEPAEPRDGFFSSIWNSGTQNVSDLADEVGELFSSKPRVESPLSSKLPGRVQKSLQRVLVHRFERADEGSPQHRFGQFLKASSVLEQASESLRERIDQDKLRQELESLGRLPEVSGALKETRDEVLAKYEFPRLSLEHQEFLAGADFYQELKTLSVEERKERLEEEFFKLKDLDPEGLLKAKRGLAERDATEQVISELQRAQDPDKMTEFLKVSAEAAEAPPVSSKAARVVGAALAKMDDVSDISDVGQQITQMVAQVNAEGPGVVDEAVRWVAHLDSHGLLTTVVTSTSLLSLLQDEFTTSEDQFRLATTVVSAGGSASTIAELPALADLIGGTEFAHGLTATSDVLGPMGSIMSAGLNGYGAWEAVSAGQHADAASHLASAVGSTLLMSAALIPSPLTPLLIVGGSSLAIGGLVGRRLVKRGQERELLGKLGLLKEESQSVQSLENERDPRVGNGDHPEETL